jgi:hypothetical protein
MLPNAGFTIAADPRRDHEESVMNWGSWLRSTGGFGAAEPREEMMRATWPTVAAVVVSIAVAVGGCGGSSSKTKTSTAATSAASSTSTTSSTPTTSNAGHISKSTRVASRAFYAFALQVTNNSAPYLSPSQAKFATHCIQNRFLAAGFNTQADVEKATHSQTHSQKVRDILTTCFLNGRNH